MNCFSELTYSIHVDGELGREQSRQVEMHLLDCAVCRKLVEDLRNETLAIQNVLAADADTLPAPAPARAATSPGVVWTSVIVVALAAVLRFVYDWLTEINPPTGAEWLNPFNRDVPLGLFFYSFGYFVNEGVGMIESVFNDLSKVVVAVVAVAAAVYLFRRRPRIIAGMLSVLVVLGVAVPAHAIERRTGMLTTVPAGTTVDDTLFIGGETGEIDGTVTGNVAFGGKRLIVKGTVKGDVVAAAQTVEIDGTVGGNLISFSQFVVIRGRVYGSSVNFAQIARVESQAQVDADLAAFGAQVSVDGNVGRDVLANCSELETHATIGRNLDTHAAHITLLAPTKVGGYLKALVQRRAGAHIDPGVTITGKTDIREWPRAISRYATGRFYFWQAVWFIGAFLIGMIVYALFRTAFALRAVTASDVAVEMGIGFLVLVATPIALVLICVTLIGIPITITGLGFYLLGLYLAKIFVGAWIGQSILKPSARTSEFAAALLLGLLIVFIAVNIPYIGGVLHFLMFLLGLGMILFRIRAGLKPQLAPIPQTL